MSSCFGDSHDLVEADIFSIMQCFNEGDFPLGVPTLFRPGFAIYFQKSVKSEVTLEGRRALCTGNRRMQLRGRSFSPNQA